MKCLEPVSCHQACAMSRRAKFQQNAAAKHRNLLRSGGFAMKQRQTSAGYDMVLLR